MSRIPLIEQKIKEMDGADFQTLCDAYLRMHYGRAVSSYQRIGSQVGKRKTVSGTPDTLIRLNGGKRIWVEYTTREKGIIAKLKSDIDSCLNANAAESSPDDNFAIKLCFNQRLTQKQELELFRYAEQNNAELELLSFDELVMDIHLHYPILAREFLGLKLDTGQIQPISNFVNDYDHKANGLATPLNNPFLFRSEELNEISLALGLTDIVIVAGPPGVGKTKLVIKAVADFLATNSNYAAFAITNKDEDIADDLKISLQADNNYLLMIDDVNRQSLNFRQLLATYKGHRLGKIKLIMTVRDYAIREVLATCEGFDQRKISVAGFKSEEIEGIVRNDPFNVSRRSSLDWIIGIANGNARLAVMAAKLVLNDNYKEQQGGVFELYDNYFRSILKDNISIDKEVIGNVLGLVSFFYTLNLKNKVFIDHLLSDFDIDRNEFHDALLELEKRELVEIRYRHVKVSEQVMSSYYFYKVFIKEKKLSLSTLLKGYFHDWQYRFRDTILPLTTAFGHHLLFEEISADLDVYQGFIKGDGTAQRQFYKLFWRHRMDDLLAFLYSDINSLPEPNAMLLAIIDEKRNDYDLDDTLDLLSLFFEDDEPNVTRKLKMALEMAFEYVRKKPHRAVTLFKKIQSKIGNNSEDSQYTRQHILIDTMIEGLGISHIKAMFFALAPDLLGFNFDPFRADDDINIQAEDGTIVTEAGMSSPREKSWGVILSFFDSDEIRILAILNDHFKQRPYRQNLPSLLQDRKFIEALIADKFNTEKFEHIHFVQRYVRWIARISRNDEVAQVLEQKFINDDYISYRKLNWNYADAKAEYDFDDVNEFHELKATEICKWFSFENTNDFGRFHRAIKNFVRFNNDQLWSLQNSIDIILRHNYVSNSAIGLALLKSYITHDPPFKFVPIRLIILLVERSGDDLKALNDILAGWNSPLKYLWQLHVLYRLSDEQSAERYVIMLEKAIASVPPGTDILLRMLIRFFDNDHALLFKTAHAIIERNKTGARLGFGFEFYKTYASRFSDNCDLLGTIYLQEESTDERFDYNGDDFKRVAEVHPEFLTRFINDVYSHNSTNENYAERNLTFVWDDPAMIGELDGIFTTLIAKPNYKYFGNHYLTAFFTRISDNRKPAAVAFLVGFIKQHHNDVHRVKAIIKTVGESELNITGILLHAFLDVNTDPEQFEAVNWAGEIGVLHQRDTIIGDLKALLWDGVLKILDAHPNKLKVLPLKAIVNRKIREFTADGEREKERLYSDPHF
ncbi:MAG: hypothetical protein EOP48_01400 [Sphingobacteriales bacterium]|nr:MAG: hypothetical protein EOP48_01400 [Sphingobacteriales bacterium]